MKIKLIISFFILFITLNTYAYGISDADLKYVMPAATYFSVKQNKIPVWKCFKGSNLIGVCFLTTDILPHLSNIYGPVKILVGLYASGVISGIKILYLPVKLPAHKKVNTPFFEIQFIGKSINEKFIVGKDINSVSGATVTVKAIASFIKKSSDIVYKNYFIKKQKPKVIPKKKKKLHLYNSKNKKSTPTKGATYFYFIILFFGIIILFYIFKLFYKRR